MGVRHSLTPLFSLLSAAWVAIFVASPAIACSCAAVGTAQEHIDRVDFIFWGTATESRMVEPTRLQDVYSTSVETIFSVDVDIKNSSETRIRVAHDSDFASCGFPFAVGRQYLVFGIYIHDNKYTGDCIMPYSGNPSLEEFDAAIEGFDIEDHM